MEMKPFEMTFHDKKSLKDHAIQFHKFYQGNFCFYHKEKL